MHQQGQTPPIVVAMVTTQWIHQGDCGSISGLGDVLVVMNSILASSRSSLNTVRQRYWRVCSPCSAPWSSCFSGQQEARSFPIDHAHPVLQREVKHPLRKCSGPTRVHRTFRSQNAPELFFPPASPRFERAILVLFLYSSKKYYFPTLHTHTHACMHVRTSIFQRTSIICYVIQLEGSSHSFSQTCLQVTEKIPFWTSLTPSQSPTPAFLNTWGVRHLSVSTFGVANNNSKNQTELNIKGSI